MAIRDLAAKFEQDVEREIQSRTASFDSFKGLLRSFPLGQVRTAKRILVLLEADNGIWRVEDFTDALKAARDSAES